MRINKHFAGESGRAKQPESVAAAKKKKSESQDRSDKSCCQSSRKRKETKATAAAAAAAESDVQLQTRTILMARTVVKSEPGNLYKKKKKNKIY